MAIDLTGISSVNEFYTDHYLATYFEQSVKDAVKTWRADAKNADEQTPYQALRDAGKLFSSLYGNSSARESADDAREMIEAYLTSLGYPKPKTSYVQLPDGTLVPLFAEYLDGKGLPRVWVIGCLPVADEDLLSSLPQSIGNENEGEGETETPCTLTCEEVLDQVMLDVTHPARFTILASPRELVLIDRNKWAEKRYLSFDMGELYRRNEESTFQAVATLLARSSLCPDDGDSLIDDLDKEARDHSSEVSDSLRYALRECVELLGNEVIYDWVHNKGRNLDTDPIDADKLTIECLRYMYRMLFLLFMEARPDLGFSPTKSEAYQKAYSLESIRALAEGYREGIDSAGDTDYIDRTLRIACQLVYDGYPLDEHEYQDLLTAESTNDVFVVPPLKAHIFDRERTELIDGARLRDSVMLQIIDKMSYTHPAKGRSERVSYGTLGINQLGGVYEALLSYRGFIAQELLYEVKREKDKFDPLDVGYFVTETELDSYTEAERVRYEKPDPRAGQLRTYEKGHFIYRLAGREREQSASYYTPESLTRCLVKYALKELLQGKSAGEILQLTICEPAMGSAAFLNEAVNQLAEAYLTKRQEELGETIPHDQRRLELQRIKMYIADRNVYGIDLNPIAVELGEVSLWLNTISQDGHVPWFGNQLHCGNSLIGARRQGYTEKDLTSKAKGIRWYDHEPERVSFETGCSKSHRIYHFLVGDPGMASYKDKVIKELEPDAIARITRWNRAFTQPYTKDEVGSLRDLSYVIDGLWKEQVKQQRELKHRTRDDLPAYGHKGRHAASHTSIRQKDKVLAEFYHSEHARNAGPYARLKFAMDYWCSLWFWPIDKADLLPTRDEFIMDLSFILIGTVTGVVGIEEQLSQQTQLDLGIEFQTDKDRELQQMRLQFGLENEVDLDKLCEQFPRLALARTIANEQHFFHWELEFADVFDERGGFDLLLGNPPWVKLEKAVLSDEDPRFAVKKLSADQTARQRGEALKSQAAYNTYLTQFVRMTGQKDFLNAVQNYPLLKGQQTNLYRCFLPQSWYGSNAQGVSAFVHPDGILNDSKAQVFRRSMLARYRYHFQFENELSLFKGTNDHGRLRFSLNIYRNARAAPRFDSIWNIFDPMTIDACYEHQSGEIVPGVRDSQGKWCTVGHHMRIVGVAEHELRTFAQLLGDSDWHSTRMPVVHAQQLMEVLECIALQEKTLGDIRDSVYTSVCWDETGARKNGTIRDEISFPGDWVDTIYSGPFIAVGNPFYQVVRREYYSNNDYDAVDLTAIPSDYLVRTKYLPACKFDEYLRRQPITSWGQPFTSCYRIANREYVGCASERTLQAAILPPGACWIHKVFGFATPCLSRLAVIAGYTSSLPLDYFLRAIGKADVNYATTMQYPLVDSPLNDEIACRALLLNCLTRDYADLWRDVWQPEFATYTWAKDDPRLPASTFSVLTDEWRWETPLRKDYERRQALVELDVLVSLALGLTLEQLITVYQLDFSVLQSYERETWYDVNGRVVCSRKAMGNFKFKPAEFRKAFGDIDSCTSGTYRKTYIDDTLPGGPVERTIEYVAPFDTCDRVEDYRTAWAFFARKYGLGEEW